MEKFLLCFLLNRNSIGNRKLAPPPFSFRDLFSKDSEQMGIHPGHEKIFTAFKLAKASLRLFFSAYWVKALYRLTIFLVFWTKIE